MSKGSANRTCAECRRLKSNFQFGDARDAWGTIYARLEQPKPKEEKHDS
jgi:hypothetical protein